VEVLVIGDGPDPESEAIVREAGDERARWTNLPQRYVYPDADRHWLAVSTLTRNEGYRLASGRWLFDFDDDDSLPPNAVELLLETARERRAEAVQGVLRELHPDGSSRDELAVLPDRLPLKGALVHSHLRFFERDHVASALGIAGDWFRGERMLRAGVRIELVDQITYDYYPSSLWSS
jgi:glycosyltransferase involved in cell wall biosynthesis